MPTSRNSTTSDARNRRGRDRTPAAGGGGNRLLLIGGVAVAAVLLIAVALTLLDDPQAGEQAVEGPVVHGQPLDVQPDSGVDPAVGQAAPTLRGTDLMTGESLDIDYASGRASLILLVAHWCDHCQVEVTELAPWLTAQGVGERPAGEVLGVDLHVISTLADPALPNGPADEWLRDEGWPTPVLADGDGDVAAEAFGLTGTPMWVLVDADGTVVGRSSGRVGLDVVEQMIAQLTRG
jgi:thiol-disulfide isomerase/thioredoxin